MLDERKARLLLQRSIKFNARRSCKSNKLPFQPTLNENIKSLSQFRSSFSRFRHIPYFRGSGCNNPNNICAYQLLLYLREVAVKALLLLNFLLSIWILIWGILCSVRGFSWSLFRFIAEAASTYCWCVESCEQGSQNILVFIEQHIKLKENANRYLYMYFLANIRKYS